MPYIEDGGCTGRNREDADQEHANGSKGSRSKTRIAEPSVGIDGAPSRCGVARLWRRSGLSGERKGALGSSPAKRAVRLRNDRGQPFINLLRKNARSGGEVLLELSI